MFASQRPVPSKAALRVLRQLAYISSGAVCGAAALVAEERRRQTCLAKKIVDNTRRLKQHPRHARAHSHHAATALRDDEISWFNNEEAVDARDMKSSYENDGTVGEDLGQKKRAEAIVLWTSDTRIPSTSARTASDKQPPGRIRAEPDAFRNNLLPSEVEKGYKKLAKRNHLRNHPHEGHHASPSGTPAEHSSERRLHPRVKHQTTEEGTTQTTNQLPVGEETKLPLTARKQKKKKKKRPELSPLESIQNHVHTFLERACDAQTARPSDAIEATRLLSTAVHANLFDASKDLCNWLVQTESLNGRHIGILTRSSLAMFAGRDFETVKVFYENLLLEDRTRHVDREIVTQSKLHVTAAILDTSDQLPLDTRLPVYHSIKHQSPEFVEGQLVQCCTDLLGEGQTRAASRLLLHCTNQHQFEHSERIVSLATQLFEAATKAGMLLESDLLLKALDNYQVQIEPCLEKLYKACASAPEMLLGLHETYATRYFFPQELYPALFTSQAHSSQWNLATSTVWNTSRPNDDSVIAACQPAWAIYLRRMARATKNLQLVKQTFARMSTWAGEGHTAIEVYNAFIRACVDAGQAEEAKRFFRQMQYRDRIQPNVVTFGWFILSAAKRQDWLAVEELLTVAGAAGELEAHPADRARMFHPILREYVKSHNSNDIWYFVSRAIEVHGFIPDQTFSEIVTESFVHCKSLDLIPHWLDYVKVRGLEGDLNARAVRKMIMRFYHDGRPSHVYLLQLCRSLSRHAPGMISEDLLLFAVDAIMHDVRHLRGTNTVQLRALAEARLLSLAQANSSIPKQIQWFGRRSEAREQASAADEQVENSNEQLRANGSLHSLDQAKWSVYPRTISEEPFDAKSAGTELRSNHKIYGRVQRVESRAVKTLISNSWSRGKHLSPHEQENQMLRHLSFDHPSEAVVIYRSFLATRGLHHSSISLDMAVYASIKAENGQTMQAEEILADAQEAGNNIAAALMPLLIRRIQQANEGDSLNIQNLGQTVKKYYEEMVSNNIPIKHHVLTTAASVLMQTNKSAEGASLLNAVFKSSWGSGRDAFDTPAMTVWLQCNIKMSHYEGIAWVISHILRHDLRIDRGLMSTLHRASSHFKLEHKHTGRASALDLHHGVKRLHAICRHRQVQQQTQTLQFGRALVKCIIRCSRQAPPIEAAKRAEIDAELLGAPWDLLPGARKSQVARAMQTARSPLSTSGKGKGSKGNEQGLRRRAIVGGRKEQAAWRALLRRGLVDEEGRKMRFRYVDATSK